MSANPAVTVAKEKSGSVETLSTGVKVRLLPVAGSLIMQVQNHIRYPSPPKFIDESTGKEYENPDHPTYFAQVQDIDMQRGLAATDAIIMFGVELVDGLPEDDTWIKKLRSMQKLGLISLDNMDMDDPIDKEFIYKRYIAIGSEDLEKISQRVGVSAQGVKESEDTFQGNS